MTAARSYSRRVRSDRGGLWSSGRPLLTWLDIELTERCNNDCLHCNVNLPAGDAEAGARESTTAEIEDFLRQAAALGCLTVRFTGGEPLLREDFEELYLAARRLGIKVMLFTNATLITPRLAALLSRIPPLEKLEVSVYGMRQTSYEGVTRTPGSYEAARRGLGLLVDNEIPFVVKGAVLPPNIGEIEEFEAWARSLPGMGKGPSYAMFFDLRTRRGGDKNGLIRSVRVAPDAALGISTSRGDAYEDERRDFGAGFAGLAGDRLFTCLSSGGKGSVDAYGNFQYCLLLRHPDTVYRLGDGSLREALTDFLPRIRSLRARNPEYLDRCGRCFIKAMCLQCPARSWSEHGTLDTPVEYLCGVAHAEAGALGFLKEGEKAWAVADWRGRVGLTAARGERPDPAGAGGREGL